MYEAKRCSVAHDSINSSIITMDNYHWRFTSVYADAQRFDRGAPAVTVLP